MFVWRHWEGGSMYGNRTNSGARLVGVAAAIMAVAWGARAEDWTPAEIDTELWLDADDASTITETGSAVSQWADKSGNGSHATQATGSKQPVYTSSDNTLGGMPSVGTGGLASKYLVTPEISAKRIYAVIYFGDGTETVFPEHCAPLCGPGQWGTWRVTGGSGGNTWLNQAGQGAFNDSGTYRDGSTASATTALPMPATLWKLDASDGRTNTWWRILQGDNDGWARWDGALGELIFTDGTEDLATQQRIEGYLAHKWGLEGNLPADHPYKPGAPTVPTPWTPAHTGTELWLDADDGSTIIETGGLVSQWDDKSGNARHAAQATGSKQPVYVASDSMLGGMPSVGTGGLASKYLTTPEITAKRIYAVMYFGDGSEAAFPEHCAPLCGPGQWGTWRITGGTGGSAWHSLEGQGAFNDAGTYLNGSATSSTTALPMPAALWKFDASGDRTNTWWRILQGDNDGWARWDGALGELIFTDGTEDLDTQRRIEGYLAWKWGLEGNLPADHPYKSSEPFTSPGTVGFEAASLSTTEGDSGTKTVTVTVNRTGGVQGAVSVDYATSDGTAAIGDCDYLAASGTLTWEDGDYDPKTFDVTIIGDTDPGADETINLALSNATGNAVLGLAVATIMIDNDDDGDREWTPADISPVLWLDAADVPTITETGGLVSQWDDKSGNGNHATQATGTLQPVYTGSDGMLGGMPSVGTGGLVSKYLVTPEITAKRIYAVMYFGDGTETAFPEHCAPLCGPGQWGTWRVTGGSGGSTWLNLESQGAFNDVGTYRDGSTTSSTTALPMPATLWKLDASDGRTNTWWRILQGDNGGYARWDGAIGELIFTDGTEDLATQQKIEGYLAHKWGLEASLPADHPHQPAAPTVPMPWTPAETHTELWLDADDASTITETGGLVSQWSDKSSNGNHATQGTGVDQPFYAASDSMFGGMPSIGTGGVLDNVWLNVPSTTAQRIYMIAYFGNGSETVAPEHCAILSSTGSNGEFRLTGGTNSANWNLGNAFNDAGTYRDGSMTSSTVMFPMPATLWKFDSSAARTQTCKLLIGNNTGWARWNGAIGELIFTDGTEDLATQQRIEGYLAWKWGLEGDLPADHPYKSNEPASGEQPSPGALQFSASDYSVPEGDAGSTTVTVTVTRNGGSGGAVSVDYATSDGTATLADNDYVAASGTLSWADGDVADKTFTVTINGDTEIEPDEILDVTLLSPTGGAELGAQAAATVTIVDDDNSPGALEFSGAVYALDEGDAGATLVTITVTRTGGTAGAVSVDYATSDGTATLADNDYVAASGTLSWADGYTDDKAFDVTVNCDTDLEADETVDIALSNVTGGATLGLSAATVTIQNDDAHGTLQFSAADYAEPEGDTGTTAVTVTVTRTGGSDGAVSVDYATSDGTATLADNDYLAASGTLNWADGDADDKTFEVMISGDTDFEADETVGLVLSSPTGGATLGSQSTATVTMKNDDALTSPITVGPGGPGAGYHFDSIQTALDALDTWLGGAVFLDEWVIEVTGTLNEAVAVPDTLRPTAGRRLIVSSDTSAVLDGEGLGIGEWPRICGILVRTGYLTLRGIELRNFLGSGVYADGGDGYVFEYTHVHGGGTGFTGRNASGQISNCTVEGTSHGIDIDYGGWGIDHCLIDVAYTGVFVTHDEDLELTANTITSGDYGVIMYESIGPSTLVGNRIRGRTHYSEMTPPGEGDIWMRNNVIYGSDSAYLLFESHTSDMEATLENNTVHAGNYLDVQWRVGDTATLDVGFKNNIFSSGGTGHVVFYVPNHHLPWDRLTVSSDYNCWYGDVDFKLRSWYLSVGEWDLDGWRDASGQDFNSISADPLFADPANSDFHLKSQSGRWDPAVNGGNGDWAVDAVTSPCIDAGNPSSPVGDEPQDNGGRINIGAYGGTGFASKTASDDLPGAFSLLSPDVDEQEVDLTATLAWNDSPGADTYECIVSLNSDFTTLVLQQTGITESSFTVAPGILMPGTEHHWKVIASNTTGRTECQSIFSFTTASPSPPVILSICPTSGSVGLQSVIRVTFDSPMDTSLTANPAVFSLVPQGGTAVNGTFSWDGVTDTVMTFTPSTLLSFNTEYTLTVNTGAIGANGMPLAQAYTSSLQTISPPEGSGLPPGGTPSGNALPVTLDHTGLVDLGDGRWATNATFSITPKMNGANVNLATHSMAIHGPHSYETLDSSFTGVAFLQDGQYEITVSVWNEAGDYGDVTLTVVWDTTPPEISITDPFRHISGQLRWLYISDDSSNEGFGDSHAIEPVGPDTDTRDVQYLRNVIHKDKQWSGSVEDSLSGIDLDSVTYEVLLCGHGFSLRELLVGLGGFPGYPPGPGFDPEQFADEEISGALSLDSIVGPTPCHHDIGSLNEVPLLATPFMGAADSDYVDEYGGYYANWHIPVFTARDRAGNESALKICTKVDTSPPGPSSPWLHGGGYEGTTEHFTADTVAVEAGGTDLYRQGWFWLSSTYRNYIYLGDQGWYLPGELLSDSSEEVTFTVTDFAGNSGSVTSELSRSDNGGLTISPQVVNMPNSGLAFELLPEALTMTATGDFHQDYSDDLAEAYHHHAEATHFRKDLFIGQDWVSSSDLAGKGILSHYYEHWYSRWTDDDGNPVEDGGENGTPPGGVSNGVVTVPATFDPLYGLPGHWSTFLFWDCYWEIVTEDGVTAENRNSVGNRGTPRGVNLLVLEPDAVLAGETVALKIRGGFPKVPTEFSISVLPRRKEDTGGGSGPPPGGGTGVTIAAALDAAEPDSAGEFVVTRAGDLANSLVVLYEIDAESTATGGTDYNALSGSVTIPAGQASATIVVTPIADDEDEDTETVIVTLQADAAYEVGSPGTATVRIFDNWVSAARVVEEDPFYATIFRTIEFDLQVPDDAFGFYDIEVTCKDADEGVDGYVMEKVLKILKMEMLVGEVDPASGRGRIGPPDEVLGEPTSGIDFFSHSTPLVDISALALTNIAHATGERLVADLSIEGTVSFALADIVPGGEADPTEVAISVNGEQVGTPSLTKIPETACFLRPYAATFTFTANLPSVPVRALENDVEAVVVDPLLKHRGADSATVTIRAVGDDEPTGAAYLSLPSDSQNQAHRMSLDFTGGASLDDIAALGYGGVPITFPDVFGGSDSVFPGRLTVDGGPPVVSSQDGQVSVTLTEYADLGLETTAQGRFVGLLATGVGADVPVFFRETAADSSIFKAVRFSVELTLPLDPTDTVIDTVDIAIQEVEFEDTPGTQETLLETGASTYVFADADVSVQLPGDFHVDDGIWQNVSVTIDMGTRGTHEFLLHETAPDTSVFRLIFDEALPLQPSLVDKWVDGPWEVTAIEHAPSTGFGSYRPFVTRIEVAPELKDRLLADGKCEVFGVEHDLVEYEGNIYCAGSTAPGVFTVHPAPHPVDPALRDAVLGAGHIAAKPHGFIFTTLRGSFLGTTPTGAAAVATKKMYVEGGGEIYRRLVEIADERREKRLKASPNWTDVKASYYKPHWLGTDPENDYPMNAFIDFAWNQIWVKAKAAITPVPATFDAAVSKKALEMLVFSDPRVDPAGFAGGSNGLYRLTYDLPAYVGDPADPADDLPAQPEVPGHPVALGSRWLVGHWNPDAAGRGHAEDYSANSQTITDILHFNSGIGYGKIRPDIQKFFAALRDPNALIRKVGTVIAFYEAKILEEALDESAGPPDYATVKPIIERFKELKAKKESTPPTITTGELVEYGLKAAELAGAAYTKVAASHKFREISHIMAMEEAWRGGPTRDSLDLFLAYDIASGEGFAIFGIDGINDVIMTEAGARLGEALQGNPAAGISPLVVDSDTKLETEIEKYIREARQALLAHPVFSPAPYARDRAITALLSVQFNHDGTSFVPVSAKYFSTPHVWKSTLGICLEKNKGRLGDEASVKSFADEVEAHLRTGKLEEILPADPDPTKGKQGLSVMDVEALHQTIEVLSFIGEGRSKTGE